jgi:hypothetical protein
MCSKTKKKKTKQKKKKEKKKKREKKWLHPGDDLALNLLSNVLKELIDDSITQAIDPCILRPLRDVRIRHQVLQRFTCKSEVNLLGWWRFFWLGITSKILFSISSDTRNIKGGDSN